MLQMCGHQKILNLKLLSFKRFFHKAAVLLVHNKQVEEIKIPVPWGHISGKWWGPMNIQPLLGLHGWQDNAGSFDRLAPLLPPNISLLAVDLPGHGLSSHFPRGQVYHQFEFLVTLRRIVKHFQWEKVSFLGHSMGSILSFMYASFYNDGVENYIGIDALKPYSHNPSTMVKKWGKSIDIILDINEWDPSNTPSYTYEEAVERLMKGARDSLSRESCEILMVRGAKKLSDGRYSFTRDPQVKKIVARGYTHEFVLKFASNIKCNVLNIKANPGLVYEKIDYHNETVEVVRKSAKRFDYHVVNGLHHLHINDPNSVAPIINNFLESVG